MVERNVKPTEVAREHPHDLPSLSEAIIAELLPVARMFSHPLCYNVEAAKHDKVVGQGYTDVDASPRQCLSTQGDSTRGGHLVGPVLRKICY
jgi:hypothetical protein